MIEPTGPQGISVKLLVDLVAASSTFQAKTGLESATEANERIFYPWLQESINETKKPCAVIQIPPGFSWVTEAGGGQNYMVTDNGVLRLGLYDNERFPDAWRDSFIDFTNFVDGVTQDIASVAAKDGNLAFDTITQVEPPAKSDPREDGGTQGFWGSTYDLTWGQI